MPSVCTRLVYFAMCDGFQFYHLLTNVFLDFLLHKAYKLDFSLEQDIAVMPPPHICECHPHICALVTSPGCQCPSVSPRQDSPSQVCTGLALVTYFGPGLLAEECARRYSSALWFPLRVQLSSLGWWVWSF